MITCKCKEILNRNMGVEIENVRVHLSGCPESETYKEYKNLKWWKRLFIRNPQKDYLSTFYKKNML